MRRDVEFFMISSEPVELGRCVPNWLFDSITSGAISNALFIHPTSEHRNAFMTRLRYEDVTVQPNHHVTYDGLIRQLASDLRLHAPFEDDVALLEKIHNLLEKRASEFAFPVLHNGAHPWTFAKTQRIIKTLRTLLQAELPWNWESNPGFDDILSELQKFEETHQKMIPFLTEFHVNTSLKTLDKRPFHLQLVDGVIVLNHPPDYSPIQTSILQKLSSWLPFHQLIAQGQIRLGYRGSSIVDAHFDSIDSLPLGLDKIERDKLMPDGWQTSIGLSRQPSFLRILLEDKMQTIESVCQFISEYLQEHQGKIIIIDPCKEEHHNVWRHHLSMMGLPVGRSPIPLQQTPYVQQLVGLARIGYGVHAWSLNYLLRFIHTGGLPLKTDLFPGLKHPQHENWRPVLHQHVLQKCSTIHHVLGGPGALGRWRGTLSQMQPIESRYETITNQEIEETLWALASISRLMSPLLSPEDQYFAQMHVEGPMSEAELPLPSSPSNVFAWFEEILEKIDWEEIVSDLDQTNQEVQALEKFVLELRKLQSSIHTSMWSKLTSHWFFERMAYISTQQKTDVNQMNSDLINIMTPEQAFGLECDLLILTFLDLESWSMKQPVIPWLDEFTKKELGFLSNSSKIRQGRHYLRHLLNCSPSTCIFDASLEEGGEPATPLAEWYAELNQDEFANLASPFEWMMRKDSDSLSSYWGTTYDDKDNLHWVIPKPLRIHQDKGSYLIEKNGSSQRNIRQNVGLQLKYGVQQTQPIHRNNSFLPSLERALHQDRISRQPSKNTLNRGESLTWESRKYRTTISDLKEGLNLVQAHKVEGLGGEYPHLGLKGGGKSISPYIDPRPLPPAVEAQPEIEHFSGIIESSLEREHWSPSRLQTWIECPRKGWAKQFLNVEDAPSELEEDINAIMRGDMVHEILAHILNGHGVVAYDGEVKEPIPLHEGPISNPIDGWVQALDFLATNVTWLELDFAISVHRCRSLIGSTPEAWRQYLEGKVTLQPQGSLGDLIQKTYDLSSCAPIAVEWPVSDGESSHVNILQKSDVKLCVNGFADRVDIFIPSEELEDVLIDEGFIDEKEFGEPFPMQYVDQQRSAQRYVIIRDIKTVNGPKSDNVGKRHFKGLVREVQLALYARAWEITHPNDRVIGVGISEVGEWTEHYVEIDTTAFPHGVQIDGIGKQTKILSRLYPSTIDEKNASSPFRVWMNERIETAMRVIETASNGYVNPTPGSHCSYCPINNVCTLFDLAGGEMK
jgi:hypothetical protein